MRKIEKDLSELTDAGLLTAETAENIRMYYAGKKHEQVSPLVLVFGILGALLVGLGITLIIAHNWDELSRLVKIFYAMLPLLLAQLTCGYVLWKRASSRVWREGGAVFLFFAVAASISIVSQVYNIPGEFSAFLLTWMLLGIPVVYIMRSAMTSLLIILGITTYACALSYFEYPREVAWYYWLMLAAILPFFIQLSKSPSTNFIHFHRWFLALSVVITLNMFPQSGSWYMLVAYMSLFSFYIMLGSIPAFSEGRLINNAFLVTGSFGSTFLLLLCTFHTTWNEIARENDLLDEGFFVAVVLSLLAAAMLVYSIRKFGTSALHPVALLFLVFIFLFEAGKLEPYVAMWLVNLVVLAIAVLTTWRGADRDNMFVLNYGLLIMAVLILCRFFDTDMSFVLRGILFLIVGISFFGANYWVLKRRKLQNL